MATELKPRLLRSPEVKKFFVPRSGKTGIVWPAIPKPQDAAIVALQYELERSQWLPPAKLEQLQLQQVGQLLRHALKTVPYYQDKLEKLRPVIEGRLTMAQYRQFPILRRSDIQDAAADLQSTALPEDHGAMYKLETSGSTGQPIKIMGSGISSMYFSALTLRYHLWHHRDFSASVASIRNLSDEQAASAKKRKALQWVPGYRSGQMHLLDMRTPVSEQMSWLCDKNPDYLLAFPNNLKSLLQLAQDQGIELANLRHVISFGEVVEPSLRRLCQQVWGVPLIDAYSAHEIGVIAIQCPHFDHYHIQAEDLLVEILNDEGEPCQTGEVGRIVITDLHNFATPLIRYEIGDYAEVGEQCPCGRGLPVINRVLGRVREMLILPNGDKMWPSIEAEQLYKAPLKQFQLVQRSPTEIEVLARVSRPMSKAEESNLIAELTEKLMYGFTVTVTYVDEIPRQDNGKFADFRVEFREGVCADNVPGS